MSYYQAAFCLVTAASLHHMCTCAFLLPFDRLCPVGCVKMHRLTTNNLTVQGACSLQSPAWQRGQAGDIWAAWAVGQSGSQFPS